MTFKCKRLTLNADPNDKGKRFMVNENDMLCKHYTNAEPVKANIPSTVSKV